MPSIFAHKKNAPHRGAFFFNQTNSKYQKLTEY